MTYASIILPYNPKGEDTKSNPKEKQKLMGNIKSALKNAGASVKNAITNPGQTIKKLGKYMTDDSVDAMKKRADLGDKVMNKFSGIAVSQMLVNGNVSNKSALNYLFLGFAPAMDKQAIAMGYSGANQMKDAVTNGSINVGSFIKGFSNTLKAVVDLKNELKGKESLRQDNIIELDITLNHNEEYQSETPDRRVEAGINWSEVLNNLPETFSLDCGLQDGRRYSVTDFKSTLIHLRKRKIPFKMTVGGESLDNIILQNFRPAVLGARSGIDYTLDVKKVRIGSVEMRPVNIRPIPNIYGETTSGGGGIGQQNIGVETPYFVQNPIASNLKLSSKKRQSALIWLIEGGAKAFNIKLGGI